MSRINDLENSFFKAFKPVFIVQSLVGNARVNIVNNLVYPRFWYQKVYSCILFALCCVAVIHLTNTSAFYEIDDTWSIQTISTYIAIILTLFINGSTMIVNNFFNVTANCNLMTNLQQIYKDLKITTNERHYKYLYRMNCLMVAIMTVFHCFGNIFIVMEKLKLTGLFEAAPAIVTLAVQDVEIVLFVGIIMFLILRVRYINAMLNRIVKGKWESLEHFKSSTIICNLFYAYRKILIAYELTEITFGPYLFLLVLHLFSTEMLALERCFVQEKIMSWTAVYLTLKTILKVYSKIVAAGLFVSYLEGQFMITKTCCLRIITYTESIESRSHAKNILRLVSLVHPMTIYRMFTIHSLPVQLAAVTATYSVVLLQFALQSQDSANDITTENNHTFSKLVEKMVR